MNQRRLTVGDQGFLGLSRRWEHPKKTDDDCVLAMGGPLFQEVKAPSEVVAMVANHGGGLVRELEECKCT